MLSILPYKHLIFILKNIIKKQLRFYFYFGIDFAAGIDKFEEINADFR